MYAVGGQGITANKQKKSKKKPPKNAFSFYLDEAMKELRAQGRPVANKSEAVPLVHEKWKNMTAAQKAPYEAKAKEWKMVNRQQPRPGRLDCTGRLIDDRVDFDDFLDKKRKENRKAARALWPKGFGVCNTHFYIISFKSLFELPDEEGYQPCEVACVDYTLREGILRKFHYFIDPGPIKMGMRAEVNIFGERTHRIPETNFELACGQYDKMWRELLQFVRDDSNLLTFPPLYTRVSELRKTLFCLDWMAARAGIANRLHKIYELEDILVEMFDHAGIARPSRTTIEDGCSSSMYDYETDTKCQYHDEIECIHCALLTVNKCCYWMSDCLSTVYGFEVTENHLPVRQAPSYIVTPPEQLVIDEMPRRTGPRINPLSKESGYDAAVRAPPALVNRNEPTQFASRDIRYRGQYEIVPHGLEGAFKRSDEGDDGTISADSESSASTVTNVTIYPCQPSSNEATGNRPSANSKGPLLNRRPKTKPFVNIGVMAAQFQNTAKVSGTGYNPPGIAAQPDRTAHPALLRSGVPRTYAGALQTGSNDSSISEDQGSVTSSEASLPQAQTRSIIGLGRGRGKFFKQ